MVDAHHAAPIAVIGGGLAGLSAALDLTDAGREVVLFERRPYVGGKAYSFQDPNHDVVLDNGQHITMRCCTAFQSFLERIGCADIVRYQDHLEVAVIDPDSRRHHVSLIAGSRSRALARLGLQLLPAPLHMFPSLVTYEHLGVGEKARLALAIEPIRRMSDLERMPLDRQSFEDWLHNHHQTDRTIDRFWDLIVLPTCNDRSRDVSAAQAIQVLQEGFTRDARAADIGLFTRGLGEVAEAALQRLRDRGARIELNAAVRGITTTDIEATAVRFGRDETIDVSAVVLALPPKHALELIPPGWRRREPFWRLAQHEVSPIINVHMQWDRPVMRRDFVAALDPDAQFIFHRSKIHGWPTPPHWISVSLSGAHELIDRPQEEIVRRVERAVRQALRRTAGAELLATRVVKEAEAAFRPKPGMNAHRVRPRHVDPQSRPGGSLDRYRLAGNDGVGRPQRSGGCSGHSSRTSRCHVSGRRRTQSASPFEEQFAYARAVRVGDVVHVSGTAAIEPDGTVTAGGAGAQAERCLTIIAAALEELGGSLSDVVRTRIYLTDIDDYPAVGEAHRAAFAEVHPAATLVEVTALIQPEMLVEIEADAIIDARD